MFASSFGKAVTTVALLGALTMTVVAQDKATSSGRRSVGPGVAVKVGGTVDQTVERLKKMVADNGMMVMGEIQQGKMLAVTGLRVESQTIFVGNPNVGKQLFSQEPGVGLVVPVRINIHEGARGQTYVRYIPPSQQLNTFGNDNVNRIAKMLDGKLQNMVAMLAK